MTLRNKSTTTTMAEKALKPKVRQGFTRYFSNAVIAVTKISEFGFRKHGSWGGWRNYPAEEYENACDRHTAALGRGEIIDPESGYPHRWHKAWNALAEVEFHYEEDCKMICPGSAIEMKPAASRANGRLPTT